MKKLTLFLLINFLIFKVSAQAIHGVTRTPELTATSAIRNLQVKLNLTDDQKNKLYKILLTHYTKIDSLNATKAEPQTFKLLAINDDQNIATILSAQQFLKFQEWKIQVKAKSN